MSFIKRCIRALGALLPLICSIIGSIYVLCGNEPLIIIPSDTSFHFNIITVNALFGGFLYTNYSLLIGVLDNPIVKKVKNTKIIKKRNEHILRGISWAIFSVIAGICLILTPPKIDWFLTVVRCFMLNFEIVFMTFQIFYFLLSLKEMSVLVNAIHNSENAKTEEEINVLKEKIKNSYKE